MTKKILIDEAVVKQALEALEFYENDNHVTYAIGPEWAKSREQLENRGYVCVNMDSNLYVERGTKAAAANDAIREALQANNKVVNATEADYSICPTCGGMATDPIVPVAELWEMFPGYLIDKYEGETLTEELLQQAMAELLRQISHGITSNQGD